MMFNSTSGPVYLDYQATTPVDPRVFEIMRPYYENHFGNPHSINHVYGWEAHDAVQMARGQVADFIGADDDEIIFTSGATESCNLAIRGVAKAIVRRRMSRNRFISVQTEHSAVFNTVLDLNLEGFESVILPVGSDGLVDPANVESVIDERTALVSVMAANNEIGVIQPLDDISALCHANGAIFHTDATQAAGRIDINVDAWGVDLLSLSAHKMYGPKGIGVLFVRRGVPIDPIQTGGGQEKALRSGTVPVGLSAGFGGACQIASDEWAEDTIRMTELTFRLTKGLQQEFPDLRLFGHSDLRVPGSLNIGIPGLSARQVIEMVSDRLAISTGSACLSDSTKPSRILLALGVEPEIAESGIRISLGRFTSIEEIDVAIDVLTGVGAKLDLIQ